MNAKHLVYSVIFLGVLILIWWLIKDEFLTAGRLHNHRLPNYATTIQPFYEKLLLLRRESPNGNLLLKILNEDIVVRYRFDTQRVENAGVAAWHTATEKVKVCQETFGVGEEEETGKYNTYGKYTLAGARSKNGSKLAIVSAFGPKGPAISLIPGLGGGTKIWGTRYLEIKAGTEPYKNLRKTVQVDDKIIAGICWTDDEDAVVYFDGIFYDFSVMNLAVDRPNVVVETLPLEFQPDATTKPDLSRFTGRYRDYGIDEDGDGFFEKIAVEVETETTIPGRYKIFLALRSADEKYSNGTIETELKGGLEMTKILFDAKEWFESGIDGKFKIEHAQLIYGDHPTIELRENFGDTKNYSRDQLKREAIIFTGGDDFKLVDRVRDGRYRGLEFSIGVDVLKAGEYEYQGDLYHEKWTSTADGIIGSGEGRGYLRKGRNVINMRFDGREILEFGKSGKFQLRNVLIKEKGKKGKWVSEGIFTRHFELNEFSTE